MIYSDLTEDEVNKIKIILDRNRVIYDVQLNEGKRNQEDTYAKSVLNIHGSVLRTNAFYTVAIEASEFSKFSVEDLEKLQALNIYPELVDVPFHSDTVEIIPVVSDKVEPWEKVLKVSSLIMLFIIACMYIDQKIIRFFPDEESEVDGVKIEVFEKDRMFSGHLFE
jgi:hypothetical protein